MARRSIPGLSSLVQQLYQWNQTPEISEQIKTKGYMHLLEKIHALKISALHLERNIRTETKIYIEPLAFFCSVGLQVVFKPQIHPSSRKIYFSIGFLIIIIFYEKTTHRSKYTPSHRSPSIDKAAQNTWKDFKY